MNIFGLPRRPTSEWYAVGLTSSFPDVASQDTSLSEFSLCDASRKPGCRVFEIPKEHGAHVTEIAFVEGNSENHFEGGELKDQVLVFQYKGKYHAVDHVSRPLINGDTDRLLMREANRAVQSNALIRHIHCPRALPSTSRTLVSF